MTTQPPFFQRFQSDDPFALAKKVEQDYEDLAHAHATHDELRELEILIASSGSLFC